MSHPTRRLGCAMLLAAALASPAAAPNASAASPTYSVTVGTVVSQSFVNDTPDTAYIDKDGSFHITGAHSLYGASDSRQWKWYSGTNFDSASDDATRDNAVNPNNSNDRNNDTTWRCNNSPTGATSTYETNDTSYAERNYCDIVGTWVDPDTGDWYGLVHNEFTPEPFGAYSFSHYDAIDYTVSHDQGLTWSIVGHAITSPYSTTRNDNTAFPHETWDYGDGDPRLFVDTASGYFYAFYGTRIVGKASAGGGTADLAHVARAPISGKMATGTWQKWYNGAWTQAGVGGQESNLVPVGSANPDGTTNQTGYTPTTLDYNPQNSGTVTQQIAAHTMPPTSPLFVMDIAYDAYLGLYIGEPEGVDRSGNAPQQYYATSDLATQKWTLIGDTGTYHTASWYRWFADSGNKAISNAVIGKTFRAYCSIACSNGSGGEYANVTVDSSAPAAAPVDLTKTYTIGNGNGRVLAQVSGGSATTSVAAPTGSSLEAWSFAGNGDGSYRISNASTGQLLGVDSTANAGRAWGAKPTVTAATSSVGQQWFIIANTSPAGTFRIVNRYSGLVLGMSATTGRLAETTPLRSWTDTSGTTVGGGRTATEQTVTLTVVGSAPSNLNGTHTVVASGKALDDPGHSKTAGTQLITWTPNGGVNQNWTFTQQSDGSYQIVNGESGLCIDDSGWSTTSGSQVVQWTCNGGANQHWNATKQSDGTYTLSNSYSNLLLTTASTADGALVTQQTNTGSALQRWSIQ